MTDPTIRKSGLARMLPTLVVASLALGLATGAGLRMLPVSDWRAALVDGVDVVGTMWVNAIRMTVIPLIVPLLIGSIAGARSRASVGRLGIATAASFVGLVAIVSVATALAGPLLFAGLHVDPATTAGLRASVATSTLPSGDASLGGWLRTLIPTNPIKAAADGTMLSIIVFAVAFGFAALAAPITVRQHVTSLADMLSGVMLVMVQAILLLAPIGVFALTLVVGARVGGVAFGAMAYFIGATTFWTACVAVALFALIVVRGRMSPMRAIRGLAPGLLVALGTSSSLSALPAMLGGARDEWRQREEVYGFVLPLAVSAFKLLSAANWILDAVFVALLYGVPLGPTELAFMAGYALLFNATVPGIPGGGVIVVSPLFLALGLPLEGLAILFAINPIVDRIGTLGNVMADMTVTAMLGVRSA